MIQDQRLIEAILSSGIKRVTLLDDAFDLPNLDGKDYGAFYELFETEGGVELAGQAGFDADAVKAARDVIVEEDFSAEPLQALIRSLHQQFLMTRDPVWDPTGVFRLKLSNNLSDVDPLLQVLNRCACEITLVGVETPLEDQAAGQTPDLIFADYYLSGSITTHNAGTASEQAIAKEASASRLEELLAPAILAKKHPSVVLMSSKDVSKSANDYRERVSGTEGKVYASRFGFIRKFDLEVAPRPAKASAAMVDKVQIQRPSADVLLDIIQSHPFGSKLHDALKLWIESSKKGVDNLAKDIETMELKDFAYLVTYRLAQEEIGLFDYLEWFFGECLLGSIGEVAAKAEQRPTRAGLDKHASLIEGAYEGRTDMVAELYHRARVETPRQGREQRMGDLWVEDVQPDGRRVIWAVLTPDCDLIERDGATAAKRLLTVSGHMIPYDAAKSSLADFLVLDSEKFSVAWDLKNLQTRDDTKGLTHVGTLRPIYAQELQRRALQDLSRIGVSVAPVVRMEGTITLKVRQANGRAKTLDLGSAENTQCDIYPSRGGSDVSRIALKRMVAENLVAVLAAIDPDTLDAEVKVKFKSLASRAGLEGLRQTLTTGAGLGRDLGNGVVAVDAASPDKAWCSILVTMTPT